MRAGKKACFLAGMFVLIVMCSCSYDRAGQKRSLGFETKVDTVLKQQADEQTAVITIDEAPVRDENVPEEDMSPREDTVPEETGDKKTDGIDIDLTILSSTMVYAEVYDMMYYPENYVGKSVKMEGLYASAYDDASGKRYYACIIQDATACCSQGIEFEPEGDIAYPDDFPIEGENVCVTGTFDTYTEGEQTYCTLRNARLL